MKLQPPIGSIAVSTPGSSSETATSAVDFHKKALSVSFV